MHRDLFYILAMVLLAIVTSSSLAAVAQDAVSPPPNSATGEKASKENSVDTVQRLITTLVRDNVPHTYEDTKKWNLKDARWDGLHLQLDGFQLKTKRRWKEVNDGDWSMYRLELLDPKEEFAIRLENFHETKDGRLGFDTYFTARVHAFGRVSKWVKGVQLYSFSADAIAKVTLHVRGTVGLTLDVSKLPPDVQLQPTVTAADVELHEFKLYKVSDVGGEIAQQLGRTVQGMLENKIAESNHKLPDKINRQIAKKEDDLRFSMQDLLASKWAELAKHAKQQSEPND